MPADATEALEVADAIAGGRVGESWGRSYLWPSDRVAAGDWTPAQWFDAGLAEVVRGLEANSLLEPAGLRHDIGPDGRRIQDAYRVCDEDSPEAVPGFHSVSGDLRRTMLGVPDVAYRPREGKERLAERYRARRSELLVPMRVDTVAGRVTGLWAESPSFGWWVPISVDDADIGKALAVWWNTTPARLMLLNRRGRKLTYPVWQVAHLREIGIPKPDNPAWAGLRAAFDELRNTELLPMRQAEECEVRRVIDEAAASALGIDSEVVAGWRQRLAVEPTISNARAPIADA